MKHICVYTTKKILNHKKKNGRVYWTFSNVPKILDKWWNTLNYDLRLYFAVNGFIVGYFFITEWNGLEADFDSISWTKIFPIKQKAFQGFKYVEEV